MSKHKKVIDFYIDEETDLWGIDAISLVNMPAIEENFIALSKPGQNYTLSKVYEEKQIVIGPALIPNKEILRKDPETGEDFYINFPIETVRLASQLFMKKNNHHNATVEHAYSVNGCCVVESWIKESHIDKSTHLGFGNTNIGTWFTGMHIENADVWKEVKEGKRKGFSIEGFFTQALMMGKTSEDQILEALYKFLGATD